MDNNRKESSMSNSGNGNTNKNEPPVDILKNQKNEEQNQGKDVKDDKTGKMKHILFKLKNSIYNSMKMYNLLLKASNKQEAQEEEVRVAADVVNDATKPKETIHKETSDNNNSNNNNNNKASGNTDSLASASATSSKAAQNSSTNPEDNNARMGRILTELKNSIDNSELIMKIYNLLLSAGKGKNES